MILPALVFLLCFGGGVMAAIRWLPGLARGPLGGLASWVVRVLIGASVGFVGLQIYVTAKELEARGPVARALGGDSRTLAIGLREILLNGGIVLGLAAIVYLIAPHGEPPESRDRQIS